MEAGVGRPRRKGVKYKLPTTLVNDELPALGGEESVIEVASSEVVRSNNKKRKSSLLMSTLVLWLFMMQTLQLRKNI